MRIVRPEGGWRILLPERRGEAVCLRGLALRCGYRIGEVCAELECGERYLHLVFVRDVGMPPKRWMRVERMVVARRELGRGRSPDEVASVLGFASGRTFRREFIAFHQMPPIQDLWAGDGAAGCFESGIRDREAMAMNSAAVHVGSCIADRTNLGLGSMVPSDSKSAARRSGSQFSDG